MVRGWAALEGGLCTHRAQIYNQGAVLKWCCTGMVYTWETMNLDPYLI